MMGWIKDALRHTAQRWNTFCKQASMPIGIGNPELTTAQRQAVYNSDNPKRTLEVIENYIKETK